MKKILYLLLLTPIIFLTSCSSDSNITTNIEDELVGSWERSSVEYDYIQYAYGWEYMEDENTGEVLWDTSGYIYFMGGGSHLLTENSMADFFGHDRYIIELHSDNTYDEYVYYGSMASTYNGTWSADAEFFTKDNQTYAYTKDENSYRIAMPNLDHELDYSSEMHVSGFVINDILSCENVYETFISSN